jgi:hypothetical protein
MFLTSSSSSATHVAKSRLCPLALAWAHLILLRRGPFVPRTAPVFFPISTDVLVEGPCNRKQSVPFYRSYNTSPWIGSLRLSILVAHDGNPPLAGTVASGLLYTLVGRQ